jgi:hypothetical protein
MLLLFKIRLSNCREKSFPSKRALSRAQADHAASISRISELEKEMTELKAWDAKAQKYQLVNIRPKGARTGGAFAYALKEEAGAAKPSHLLCENCFHNRIEAVLQEETRFPGIGSLWNTGKV